jgi:hypothetical protein
MIWGWWFALKTCDRWLTICELRSALITIWIDHDCWLTIGTWLWFVIDYDLDWLWMLIDYRYVTIICYWLRFGLIMIADWLSIRDYDLLLITIWIDHDCRLTIDTICYWLSTWTRITTMKQLPWVEHKVDESWYQRLKVLIVQADNVKLIQGTDNRMYQRMAATIYKIKEANYAVNSSLHEGPSLETSNLIVSFR